MSSFGWTWCEHRWGNSTGSGEFTSKGACLPGRVIATCLHRGAVGVSVPLHMSLSTGLLGRWVSRPSLLRKTKVVSFFFFFLRSKPKTGPVSFLPYCNGQAVSACPEWRAIGPAAWWVEFQRICEFMTLLIYYILSSWKGKNVGAQFSSPMFAFFLRQ